MPTCGFINLMLLRAWKVLLAVLQIFLANGWIKIFHFVWDSSFGWCVDASKTALRPSKIPFLLFDYELYMDVLLVIYMLDIYNFQPVYHPFSMFVWRPRGEVNLGPSRFIGWYHDLAYHQAKWYVFWEAGLARWIIFFIGPCPDILSNSDVFKSNRFFI